MSDICARCKKPGAGYADRFEVMKGKKTATNLYHRGCLPSGPSEKTPPSAGTTQQSRPNKYGAQKTVVDGITFDSKKEARRWDQLRLMLRAGKITHLDRQVKVECIVGGTKVATWIADFCYVDPATDNYIYEDVKSPITRKEMYYRLKKRLVEACHPGIQIREV